MKVTICFDDAKVVVPCGDGSNLVQFLINEAFTRYKKVASKKKALNDLDVIDLKLNLKDGGILDPDDKIIDVIEDKELILAVFQNRNSGISVSDFIGPFEATSSFRNNSSFNGNLLIINKLDDDNQKESVFDDQSFCEESVSEDGYCMITNDDLQADLNLKVRQCSDPAVASSESDQTQFDFFPHENPMDWNREKSEDELVDKTNQMDVTREYPIRSTFPLDSVELIRLKNDSPVLGIHVMPEYDEKQDLTGLRVRSVENGSIAHRDGRMKCGDLIIEINNISLFKVDFSTAQEIFKSERERQGSDLYLKVVHRDMNSMEEQNVTQITPMNNGCLSQNDISHEEADTSNKFEDSAEKKQGFKGSYEELKPPLSIRSSSLNDLFDENQNLGLQHKLYYSHHQLDQDDVFVDSDDADDDMYNRFSKEYFPNLERMNKQNAYNSLNRAVDKSVDYEITQKDLHQLQTTINQPPPPKKTHWWSKLKFHKKDKTEKNKNKNIITMKDECSQTTLKTQNKVKSVTKQHKSSAKPASSSPSPMVHEHKKKNKNDTNNNKKKNEDNNSNYKNQNEKERIHYVPSLDNGPESMSLLAQAAIPSVKQPNNVLEGSQQKVQKQNEHVVDSSKFREKAVLEELKQKIENNGSNVKRRSKSASRSSPSPHDIERHSVRDHHHSPFPEKKDIHNDSYFEPQISSSFYKSYDNISSKPFRNDHDHHDGYQQDHHRPSEKKQPSVVSRGISHYLNHADNHTSNNSNYISNSNNNNIGSSNNNIDNNTSRVEIGYHGSLNYNGYNSPHTNRANLPPLFPLVAPKPQIRNNPNSLSTHGSFHDDQNFLSQHYNLAFTSPSQFSDDGRWQEEFVRYSKDNSNIEFQRPVSQNVLIRGTDHQTDLKGSNHERSSYRNSAYIMSDSNDSLNMDMNAPLIRNDKSVLRHDILQSQPSETNHFHHPSAFFRPSQKVPQTQQHQPALQLQHYPQQSNIHHSQHHSPQTRYQGLLQCEPSNQIRYIGEPQQRIQQALHNHNKSQPNQHYSNNTNNFQQKQPQLWQQNQQSEVQQPWQQHQPQLWQQQLSWQQQQSRQPASLAENLAYERSNLRNEMPRNQVLYKSQQLPTLNSPKEFYHEKQSSDLTGYNRRNRQVAPRESTEAMMLRYYS